MIESPCVSSDFVKFEWERLSLDPPSSSDTRALAALCDALDALDLLAAYAPGNPVGSNGNVSVRVNGDGRFIVTATQLPAKRRLRPEDFVTVDRYEFDTPQGAASKVYCAGPKLPSSESILHWRFYRERPHINAIVHVHENTELLYSPTSRASWARLAIIETARYGDAGSLDLPLSVEEVIENDDQYVILRDHRPEWDRGRTGAVTFGETLRQAGDRVIEAHEGLIAAA